MYRKLSIILLTFPFSFLLRAQFKTYECADLLWTRENAVIKNFNNGDAIPFAKDSIEFDKAWENKQPAWRHIAYNPKNESSLGIEYNHYVITDPRGFAPQGWRVPSHDNFKDLIQFHGGIPKAGDFVIKRAGDDCGLSVPYDGKADEEVESGAAFWTTSMDGPDTYWFSYVVGSYFSSHAFEPGYGLSVRFVKNIDYTKAKETLTIGSQVWDGENLKVTTFSNGDPIQFCAYESQWAEAGRKKQPAYCYYDYYDKDRSNKHGYFYNYYALTDPRGLAPKNYHIPGIKDWDKLTSELKGDSPTYCAGKKMKDLNEWPRKNYCDEIALDQNNFGAIPGGFVASDGYVDNYGYGSYFWIASEDPNTKPVTFVLSSGYDHFQVNDFYIGNGAQVRCVMDEDYANTFYKTYKTINTNGMELMAENLNVSFYQNGDSILFAKDFTEWCNYNLEGKGVWSYLGFDPVNAKYGKLYNKKALLDPRGLCPKGWSVPTKDQVGKFEDDPLVFESLKVGSIINDGNNISWWMINSKKPDKTVYFLITPEGLLTTGISTSNRKGIFVRCVKN